jgi:uncharacterized protein YraI
MRRLEWTLAALVALPAALIGQQAVATTGVNVRSGPSISTPIVDHLTAGDTVSLASPTKNNRFYNVMERNGARGWVSATYLRLLAGSIVAIATPTHASASTPGTPGTSSLHGCGDGLWQHVYHPQRLLVKQQCVTVVGVIVDASKGREPDGARHEADGDTHAWLQLDAAYKDMLDAGNTSDEGGNLVFEIVCHFTVKQADAKPACAGFADHTVIPAVGTHVEITGTYVQDTNHARWNEIHPVSKIVVKH